MIGARQDGKVKVEFERRKKNEEFLKESPPVDETVSTVSVRAYKVNYGEYWVEGMNINEVIQFAIPRDQVQCISLEE